jgi:hypothetical protein
MPTMGKRVSGPPTESGSTGSGVSTGAADGASDAGGDSFSAPRPFLLVIPIFLSGPT